jgi:hypothetical protein
VAAWSGRQAADEQCPGPAGELDHGRLAFQRGLEDERDVRKVWQVLVGRCVSDRHSVAQGAVDWRQRRTTRR